MSARGPGPLDCIHAPPSRPRLHASIPARFEPYQQRRQRPLPVDHRRQAGSTNPDEDHRTRQREFPAQLLRWHHSMLVLVRHQWRHFRDYRRGGLRGAHAWATSLHVDRKSDHHVHIFWEGPRFDNSRPRSPTVSVELRRYRYINRRRNIESKFIFLNSTVHYILIMT